MIISQIKDILFTPNFFSCTQAIWSFVDSKKFGVTLLSHSSILIKYKRFIIYN